MAKRRNYWVREPLIALLALAFGLLGVPAGIFFVGNRVFGEYSGNGSLQDLSTAIWADLAAGEPTAWTLVLSPYAIILLLRLALAAWRRPRRRSPAPQAH